MASGLNKFVYISKTEINSALATSPVIGKGMISPFNNFNDRPFGIVEDYKLSVGAPEVHTHEDDLWVGLEGEVVFTLGGELIEPSFRKLPDGSENNQEISGKDIVGGEQVIVGVGDVLWIPAGVPHMHTARGIARLLIYKNPKR